MRSIDDKAYLHPGTSEGFSNTRNQKLLTMTDVEKARKLSRVQELIVFSRKNLPCLMKRTRNN
jgi:hypothetical protein